MNFRKTIFLQAAFMTLFTVGALNAQQTVTTPTTQSAPTMTKDQVKAQKKQQKQEEKAADANAKAAKSQAKAKKAQDDAIQAQQKAANGATEPKQ